MTLAAHEACARKDRQMRRHGVLRHRHEASELARRNALRLSRYQQAEGVQPSRLGERGKGADGGYIIHSSSILDIYDRCNARVQRIFEPLSPPERAALVQACAAICTGSQGLLNGGV